MEDLLGVVGAGRDPALVEAAIEALGRIGDRRCRRVLEAARVTGTLRVRRAAERVLASMEETDARR